MREIVPLAKGTGVPRDTTNGIVGVSVGLVVAGPVLRSKETRDQLMCYERHKKITHMVRVTIPYVMLLLALESDGAPVRLRVVYAGHADAQGMCGPVRG